MKKHEGLSNLVSTCNFKMVYSISITVNLNLRKGFLYHKPLKLLRVQLPFTQTTRIEILCINIYKALKFNVEGERPTTRHIQFR